MDFKLIYAKTAFGEEAMRERAKIADRNMRMLLTLVDGKATVADLCSKTGNNQLTEKALAELEEGGFIKTRATVDARLAQSRNLEQETKTAALERTSEFSTFGDKYGVITGQSETPGRDAQQAASIRRSLESSSTRTSAAPTADATNTKNSSAPNTILPRKGVLERLRALLDRAEIEADKRSIKSIRHRSEREAGHGPRRIFFALLGLVMMLVLLTIFFPYNRYRSEIESVLAQASGQSAKIGEISISAYPNPGVFVSNVVIGNDAKGEAIHIGEVRLLPELGTLFGPRRVMRRVELKGVDLPAEALGGLSGFFEALSRPISPIGAQRILLDKVNISLRRLGFSGLNGEIKVMSNGRFDALFLASLDGSLRLEARPQGERVEIEIEGRAWKPSASSPLTIDSLTAKGILEGQSLAIRLLNLRTLDGQVRGLMTLSASSQPTLVGEHTFERISAKRLGEALGIGPQFEGDAAGMMKFEAAGASWSTILSNLQAEGEFGIGRGSMSGFDFVGAARRGSVGPTRGGSTRFEQANGRFRLTPTSLHIAPLTIHSGMMQSGGQIVIGKDLRLNGEMDVQMNGSVRRARDPVSISGSLSSPVLQAGTH